MNLFSKKNQLLSALLFTALSLNFSSCGKASSKPAQTPLDLLNSDLSTLKNQDATGLQAYDSNNNGIVAKIFGGTNNNDVIAYLNLRLHYFVLATDQEVGFSANVFDQNWEKDPAVASQMQSSGAVVAAANIGMQAWLASLVANTPVQFITHGNTVDVDSSRVGIMIFGDGYEATVKTKNGNTITIPSVYRQSILVHEARHSDCTGGITEAALNIARNAKSAREFSTTNPAMACGHLHTYCPAGNAYHDLPACDGERWGAYSIEAAYDRAILAGSNLSSLDWEIMNASAIDSESRTSVRSNEDPDMSSGGLND